MNNGLASGFKTPNPSQDKVVLKLKNLKPETEYDQTDIAMAKLFSNIFCGIARYNTTAKEWYVYDGTVWKKDAGGMNIAKFAKTFADALLIYCTTIEDERRKNEYVKYVSRFSRYNNRESLIKDARSEMFISMEDFDRNGNLFNCLNGTYHLDTGEFSEHDPDDLISKCSNVIFDPEAASPAFESFINEIMMNDQAKIAYLQKSLGVSLTTDTSLEMCWIWYGPSTRNGKGTLAETISYMMGNSSGYALAMAPETLALRKNKDTRQASGDIARLHGCRFLNASEPPKRMLFDAALLKTLLGRDTIVARHLCEREFEFTPQFKLFINTNYLPQIQDQSLFTSGRINVVLFERHFEQEEQDHKLKDRLREPGNISGIFNWCLEGLKLYREIGIDPPETVLNATADYQKSSDKIQMFMDDQMIKSRNKNEPAGEAYRRYADWCEDNGFRTESKRSFFDDLQAKGLFGERGTVNGTTVKNVIRGYRFQTEADLNLSPEPTSSDVTTPDDLPF